MKTLPTALDDVPLIEPKVFEDARGFFMETYHADKFAELGLPRHFVQDNHSRSQRGVLRGLHYQLRYPQGKLVRVVRGEIFDVAVDIRRGSPTFGRWVGVTLSEDNRRQLYVPEGFAHGFCVVSETADVIYKCTDVYHPEDDYGVRWDDADVGVAWPAVEHLVSDKDRGQPTLREAADRLPEYRAS